MIEMLLSLAIVTQDQIPLRAAPTETAARHASLSMGDNLEIRGVKGDYLQVYDYRRERGGYIRATQAGQYALQAEEAPRLKAVVDFLKDQPGFEAMGVGHAAAFLKAAPVEAIDASLFEAIGKMADRLAWRASKLSGSSGAANEKQARTVDEHLDVLKSYGVTVYSVERNEKMTLCYDGEAWRRVMALPATAEQKARAALSLTRHDCVQSTLLPSERLELDLWRADLLDRALEAGADGSLPGHLEARLKIRAAGVWAGIAHQMARRPDADAAVLKAGQTAETMLAAVDKSLLVDGDVAAWNEAAIRVGASRWAKQTQVLPAPVKGRPGIRLAAGEQAGQNCVQVIEGENTPEQAPAFERCTYGQVWTSSLTVSPDGKLMTLAVQPLADWREIWIFRLGSEGWEAEAVPPAVDQPELGYIEFAGWVPGNKQFLVARETFINGVTKTSFELWNRETLKVEKRVDKPGNLTAFYRWQDPAWKSATLAIR